MEIPTVPDIQRNPNQYPEWMICMICRGGRGEVVPTYDDVTGEHLGYAVRPCPLCQGQKVLKRAVV